MDPKAFDEHGAQILNLALHRGMEAGGPSRMHEGPKPIVGSIGLIRACKRHEDHVGPFTRGTEHGGNQTGSGVAQPADTRQLQPHLRIERISVPPQQIATDRKVTEEVRHARQGPVGLVIGIREKSRMRGEQGVERHHRQSDGDRSGGKDARKSSRLRLRDADQLVSHIFEGEHEPLLPR